MNKLWVRLSLGFSGVVLLVVFVVALTGILVQRTDSNYDQLEVSQVLAQQLAVHYQTRRSWAGSEPIFHRAQAIFGRRRGRDWAFFLADAQEQVIYHNLPNQVGKPLAQVEKLQVVPVRVDQQVVGYVGLAPAPVRNRPERPVRFLPLDFVAFVGGILLTVAAITGVSGIVFGIVMSRSLTAPLNNLAKAAKAIGTRNLSQRVEEKGSHEMIAVAQAFNEMADGLEEAEQLRRNLMADVAHELRTPLSVLQGNLRAILDDVYPLEKAEVTRLYDQTRLLSRLVNDLHELAQAEARQLPLNVQETDLARLITTTGDTFAPIAESKGVTLHTNLPSNLPLIQVDEARLAQVLHNLLNNGLRHTPKGGHITISSQVGGNALRIDIADTGDGILPAYLPHVFDRFYRADSARSRDKGGAGLGLAIARAIIEAHDGQLTATSEGIPGKGSTFTITLPLLISQSP